MRFGWLIPALIACGGKQDDVDGDLAKLVPQINERYGAMLAAMDADVAECPEPPPFKGPIIMLLPSLQRIVGAPALPATDPNELFKPTNFDSHLVGSYTNQFNPKSSKRKYASELLAVPLVVVTKIDKYVPAKVSAETFQSGAIEARAVVFDGATGKAKCRVKFTAKNSDKVYAGMSQKSAEETLVSDLRLAFSSAAPNVKRYPDSED